MTGFTDCGCDEHRVQQDISVFGCHTERLKKNRVKSVFLGGEKQMANVGLGAFCLQHLHPFNIIKDDVRVLQTQN